MKESTLMGMMGVLLVTAMTAKASLYSTGTIPDGNPVGASFIGTYDEATEGNTVGALTVSLTISGGFNGNLYAYLVAPNGTLVMLLQQPGVTESNPFGYGGSGLDITLDDTASGSIQTMPETAGQVLTGTYTAAGTLGTFNNSVANGQWTLFFADLAAGGGQAQLTGWSLNIAAVPEPVTLALAAFVAILLLVAVIRPKKSWTNEPD